MLALPQAEFAIANYSLNQLQKAAANKIACNHCQKGKSSRGKDSSCDRQDRQTDRFESLSRRRLLIATSSLPLPPYNGRAHIED
jgi:hypothetical protein